MVSVHGVLVIVPAPPNIAGWKFGEEKKLAGKYGVGLIQQTFTNPEGIAEEFVFCRKSPGVTVCAVTAEGRLVLVGQYKQAIHRVVYEFPAGRLNEGADYNQVAREEFENETGYRAESITLLCATPSCPGPRKLDTSEHLYVALNARYVGSQKLDSGEHALAVVELTPAAFIQWREEGKIISSGTREAFGLALEKGYIKL